ncbi:MAG: PilT protein-like protein [Phenylobacterium sp.]|nr:PilT protein-like protein [Phenylobacterium sp.]
MTRSVLDSSAVLAVLHEEPGASRVALAMSDAVLSSVNLAEIVQRLARFGAPEQGVRAILASLNCEVADFDAEQGVEAGLLERATRAHGLSLGDRACLALARARGLPALTGDRAWARVDVGVEVVLIR